MSLSDPSPFQRFLKRVASRSALTAEEQQEILQLPGVPAQVQTNRDFVRLGERVEDSCLVVEGLVGRFGQNRDGARQITALHVPGDLCDLHSVVAPDATSALQALAVTTIVRVPHKALRSLASRFPAVAEAFWRECVVDAAVLSEWVVNVGRRDARSRTAHLLCEMACRIGAAVPAGSFSFSFPATQNHLADMLGLTPVHVNRMLMALRTDGVISLGGREVRVLDWARLADIGDFDADYLQIGLAHGRMRLAAA